METSPKSNVMTGIISPGAPFVPAKLPTSGVRKRGFNEHEGFSGGQDLHYNRDFSGERSKQARRGGRGTSLNGQMNRGRSTLSQPQPIIGQPFGDMSMPVPMPMPMTIPMPDFPFGPAMRFSPHDPTSALLALQAMGLPLPPAIGAAASPLSVTMQAENPAMPRSSGRFMKPCRNLLNKGVCSRDKCPYNHDALPSAQRAHVPSDQEMVVDEAYDPNSPSIGLPTAPVLSSTSPRAHHTTRREAEDPRGRGRGRGGPHAGQRRGGRMEFSSTRPDTDRTKTTICVEKIPDDCLTEVKIRETFGDFGEIIDVELQETRRLALVKYSSWQSAKNAFDSPKVLFDNRFVKVYWYNPDNERHQLQHREGRPPGSGPGEAGAVEEMVVDMEEVQRRTAEAQKAYEEKQAKKKETEALMKDLEERREALLKSQAEERKKLLEKLAAKQKPKTDAQGASGSGAPITELSQEEERKRAQTEALRAQVAALEDEATALGLSTESAPDQYEYTGYEFSGRGRGGRGRGSYGYRGTRGSLRGRGNLGGSAVKRADFRPRKLRIGMSAEGEATRWTTEKDEAMRQWLMTCLSEEIENVDEVEDATGLVVSFKERWMAEKCAGMISGVGGTVEGVGRVEVKWVQNAPVNGSKTGQQLGSSQSGEAKQGVKRNGDLDPGTAMDLDRAVDD